MRCKSGGCTTCAEGTRWNDSWNGSYCNYGVTTALYMSLVTTRYNVGFSWRVALKLSRVITRDNAQWKSALMVPRKNEIIWFLYSRSICIDISFFSSMMSIMYSLSSLSLVDILALVPPYIPVLLQRLTKPSTVTPTVLYIILQGMCTFLCNPIGHIPCCIFPLSLLQNILHASFPDLRLSWSCPWYRP